MSTTVGFKQPTECLGRNGVMTMAGIHISRLGDALYIAPVTSRHRIGRAWMRVPLADVTQVTKAMLDVSVDRHKADSKAA